MTQLCSVREAANETAIEAKRISNAEELPRPYRNLLLDWSVRLRTALDDEQKDPSVSLRDVVVALLREYGGTVERSEGLAPADFIERKFGSAA